LLVVEHLDAPFDTLRTVPDLVVRRLEQAGLEYATVIAPDRGGHLDALDETRSAVVLRLFPDPRGPAGSVPPDWLDIACEWVLGDLDDNASVAMRILGVEFEVGIGDASAVFHECGLARAWSDIVHGDVRDRLRTASLTFGRLPHLALAAGGPGADNPGLVARFALLRDVARELAGEVAYACIDIEATFEGLALGLSPDGWRRQGGAPPNVVAGELVDLYVPDAFPYQVLGPNHLSGLDAGELVALPNGRAELLIGAPAEWLPSSVDRYELQQAGWEILEACLLGEDDLGEALRERDEARLADGGYSVRAPEADDAGEPIPDLATIVVEGHPHSRRGTRLSVLELASWLNHEQHSDAPSAVSPVVASFVRWWAAGLDEESRQRLKPFAAAMIGTGGQPSAERTRRWIAVDWLARVHAPAWLRLAGLDEAADRLEELDSVQETEQLVRAVDVLGSAVAIASRRLDIAAAIAGTDPNEGLDQMAWDAWEQVSERSGWVAASETATLGAPSDLTNATDLRVIECSRDPRARDEIEAARVSVGDATWTTALHAFSDEAWRRGWRAADAATREIAGVGVREHLDRIAAAVVKRAPSGDELPEAVLDTAEQAARDELTRLVLYGRDSRARTADVVSGAAAAPVLNDLPHGRTTTEHPWDAARQAARSSATGDTWAVVVEDARKAVGEDAWAQAMADARTATDDLLRDGPDLVGRAVAAAVAREACSAAARGVAYRAITAARNGGSDDRAAYAAAVAALEPTAVALRERGFALLARLIDPTLTAAEHA
jgi:hypothetical protein